MRFLMPLLKQPADRMCTSRADDLQAKLNRSRDSGKLCAPRISARREMIKKIAICLATVVLTIGLGRAHADGPIRIGVGTVGPVSPQTEVDIDKLVSALPNTKAVPIVPPGDVDACVKRFVGGETDDRLDA